MARRISKSAAAVAVVEAAYTSRPSIEAWCAEVAGRIDRLLPDAIAVGIGLIVERGAAYELLHLDLLGKYADTMAGWTRDQLAARDASAFAAFYGPGPRVRSLREVVEAPDVAAGSLATMALSHFGFGDVFGFLAWPTHEGRVVACAAYDGSRPLGAGDRRTLHQIALHLENASRMHLVAGDAVAVFSPDGRVEDLQSDSVGAWSREALVHRVARIERLRTEASRGVDSEGLDAWQGLVEGLHSLVEHVDADGRRHYVAFENGVNQTPSRRLTAREASVVELAARGVHGKWAAYTLGLSNAAVSSALASAAEKIGVGSRGRLLRATGRLFGGEQSSLDLSTLTPAERDVRELVQEGRTNAEIAGVRNRSERTVANQVASILRKTGAVTRRQLISQPPAPITSEDSTTTEEG